jgi:hypothetical protein
MKYAALRSLLVVALLAAIAAVFLFWNGARSPAPGGGKGEVDPRAPANNEQAIESLRAAETLRSYSHRSDKSSARFDDLEALARALALSEVEALSGEIEDREEMDPIARGVLCAVFAQWGRLDPEAARAHVVGWTEQSPRDSSILAITSASFSASAWFSVLRGWAESAPAEVLAASEAATLEQRRLEFASDLAADPAMEELARKDPEGSVGKVPRFRNAIDGESRSRAGARYRGFFRGLPSKDEFEKHVATLVQEAAEIPDHSWPRYRKELTAVAFPSMITRNPEDLIRDIALSYARFVPLWKNDFRNLSAESFCAVKRSASA